MKKESWGWFDLKYDLAELIIPKLENYKKRYIDEGMSIPSWMLDEELDSYSKEQIQDLKEKWINELDNMLHSFNQILNYKLRKDSVIGFDEVAIQIGLNSFSKYFQHFWD